jgi:hypothetical protein
MEPLACENLTWFSQEGSGAPAVAMDCQPDGAVDDCSTLTDAVRARVLCLNQKRKSIEEKVQNSKFLHPLVLIQKNYALRSCKMMTVSHTQIDKIAADGAARLDTLKMILLSELNK